MSNSTNITVQDVIEKHLSGDIEFARRGYQAFIEAGNVNPLLYSNLATIFFAENKLTDAETLLRKAITLNPDYTDALLKLGSVLILLGNCNLIESIKCFQKVISIKPDYLQAHFNLGNALASDGQIGEAITCHQNVIKLKPDFALAYYNLGNLYFDQKQFADAVENFEMAISCDPLMKGALGRYWHTRMKMCDWSDYSTMLKTLKAAALEPLDSKCSADVSHMLSPFSLLSVFDDPALHLKTARDYAHAKTIPLGKITPLYDEKTSNSHGLIKIAFLSADYHEHPLAVALAEVFELIDREQFQIHAVSYGHKGKNSDMRARLRSAFDYFHDVAEKTDQQIATMIATLGIDIAVDLKGYTSECRPGILACRPAPVQVNYLGYPATMGTNFIDYIIADPYVIPEEEAEHYSEKIVYLPDSYLSYDRQRLIDTDKPSRRQCGLPEKGFVFCSFNNSYKVSPEIFSIWMALLKETPGSVLWLLENNHWANANLQAQAELFGIEPSRIVFAKSLSSDKHLARIQNADLFLDTLPYNAHGTATDVLWVGLPILTCSGRSFVSRVAGSLLKSIDLKELITNNLSSYKEQALKLAHDPECLGEIKHRLEINRKNSSLFNLERYKDNLQMAFKHIHVPRQEVVPDETFHVADL